MTMEIRFSLLCTIAQDTVHYLNANADDYSRKTMTFHSNENIQFR